MQMKRASVSRRYFLRASAAGAALAPFVPRLEAEAQTGRPPKRLVLWFSPNGLYDHRTLGEWTPQGTETSFAFKKILAPIERWKGASLVLKGIDWKSYELDPVPNDHPPPLSHTFCAASTIKDGTTYWGGGPSIDQFIAQRLKAGTRFESLVTGVRSGGGLGRLSYRAAREPVPAENDPAVLFTRLFDGAAAGAPGAPTGGTNLAALRAERKSVIDALYPQLRALQMRVGADDRRKIDAHLAHLRTMEGRLQAAAPSAATAPASCAKPAPPSGEGEHVFVTQGRQQMDNLALALACDLTRVATLQWSVASSGMTMPWIGVSGLWHGLAHANQGSASVSGQLVKIGEWLGAQLAYFLGKLSSIREGDGTLLDNTVVVWTSEHKAHDGGHDRRDLPYLLVGSAGGYFRTGRLLRYAGKAHNDLYVSLCHAMGLADVKTFGNPAACAGPLPGLT
jgi:hypothetical protein